MTKFVNPRRCSSTIYLSFYQYHDLSTYPSIYLFIYLSIHPSIYLLIYHYHDQKNIRKYPYLILPLTTPRSAPRLRASPSFSCPMASWISARTSPTSRATACFSSSRASSWRAMAMGAGPVEYLYSIYICVCVYIYINTLLCISMYTWIFGIYAYLLICMCNMLNTIGMSKQNLYI